MPGIRNALAFAVGTAVVGTCLVGCRAPEPILATHTPTSDTGDFGVLGAEGCNPPSPTSGAEVQATPTTPGDSAFGEFQGASPFVLRADDEDVKLVVRVTGSGDLEVRLIDPTGAEQQLAWGPEPHVASNYDRPGDEWGLGLPLNQPGCWELALDRGAEPVATFWLQVD